MQRLELLTRLDKHNVWWGRKSSKKTPCRVPVAFGRCILRALARDACIGQAELSDKASPVRIDSLLTLPLLIRVAITKETHELLDLTTVSFLADNADQWVITPVLCVQVRTPGADSGVRILPDIVPLRTEEEARARCFDLQRESWGL